MIRIIGLWVTIHVVDLICFRALSPDSLRGQTIRFGFGGEGRSRQEDVETSCRPGWAQPKQTPSPSVSQSCGSLCLQVRNNSDRLRCDRGIRHTCPPSYHGGDVVASESARRWGVVRVRLGRMLRCVWRRGRDLNSRIGYPISGFQDRHVRPLRHPSTPGQRLFLDGSFYLLQSSHIGLQGSRDGD